MFFHYIIEQLSELLKSLLDLANIFMPILNFAICCPRLAVPSRRRKLTPLSDLPFYATEEVYVPPARIFDHLHLEHRLQPR